MSFKLLFFSILIYVVLAGGKSAEEGKVKVIVDDSSLYDTSFLSGLQMYSNMYKTIELRNGMMYFDNGPSSNFPEWPAMNKYTVLTARQDSIGVALKVKRFNLTSVEYELEVVHFGKANYYQKGIASLDVGFFLGAETFEYEDEMVGGNQFYSSDQSFSFTIAHSGKKFLLARFYYSDPKSKVKMDCDAFPALREK